MVSTRLINRRTTEGTLGMRSSAMTDCARRSVGGGVLLPLISKPSSPVTNRVPKLKRGLRIAGCGLFCLINIEVKTKPRLKTQLE